MPQLVPSEVLTEVIKRHGDSQLGLFWNRSWHLLRRTSLERVISNRATASSFSRPNRGYETAGASDLSLFWNRS
jgi:hypothetical protein